MIWPILKKIVARLAGSVIEAAENCENIGLSWYGGG